MALEVNCALRHAIQAKRLTATAMAQRAARLSCTKVIEVQSVGVPAAESPTLHLKLKRQADATMVSSLGDKESLVVMCPHFDEQGGSCLSTEYADTDIASDRVAVIITDLALIAVTPHGLVLKEVAPGVSARDIQTLTELPLFAASDLSEFAAELPPTTEELSPRA